MIADLPGSEPGFLAHTISRRFAVERGPLFAVISGPFRLARDPKNTLQIDVALIATEAFYQGTEPTKTCAWVMGGTVGSQTTSQQNSIQGKPMHTTPFVQGALSARHFRHNTTMALAALLAVIGSFSATLTHRLPSATSSRSPSKSMCPALICIRLALPGSSIG